MYILSGSVFSISKKSVVLVVFNFLESYNSSRFVADSKKIDLNYRSHSKEPTSRCVVSEQRIGGIHRNDEGNLLGKPIFPDVIYWVNLFPLVGCLHHCGGALDILLSTRRCTTGCDICGNNIGVR